MLFLWILPLLSHCYSQSVLWAERKGSGRGPAQREMRALLGRKRWKRKATQHRAICPGPERLAQEYIVFHIQ